LANSAVYFLISLPRKIGQYFYIKFLNDFDKEKIVYPNMTKFLPFHYDNKKFYTNQKCFIIVGKYLKYLISFLNSKLFKVCFKDNFPELLGGTRELSKVFFDKIPVLMPNNEEQNKFNILVDEIINYKQKKQDTTDLENQIDLLFYNLFKLTEIEINIMNKISFAVDNSYLND
jgi:adenine-specific DNA-methyltransferase